MLRKQKWKETLIFLSNLQSITVEKQRCKEITELPTAVSRSTLGNASSLTIPQICHPPPTPPHSPSMLCFGLLAAAATRLGGAGALELVLRDLGALYRQLLGYAVAVAVPVEGTLVKGGVGDGSS